MPNASSGEERKLYFCVNRKKSTGLRHRNNYVARLANRKIDFSHNHTELTTSKLIFYHSTQWKVEFSEF